MKHNPAAALCMKIAAREVTDHAAVNLERKKAFLKSFYSPRLSRWVNLKQEIKKESDMLEPRISSPVVSTATAAERERLAATQVAAEKHAQSTCTGCKNECPRSLGDFDKG